tara:strand:- start:8236 stop:8703 length:468 start_codon:yes stop_codon:yes gene_type:complete
MNGILFVAIYSACTACTAFTAYAGGGSGTEPGDYTPDRVENVTAIVNKIFNNYDGDTFRAYIDNNAYHEPVRIVGVDTPEINGKCELESKRAVVAKEYLEDVLAHANNIVLLNPGRDRYDRVLAVVIVDGHDLSQLIIDSGNGRVWRGRRESWCD